MSEKYTPEQLAAINARGKIIVSASAGSGKTFVMIQKLCDLLQRGGDLDGVLAVTFTKKAAAQIKEKLRKTLISRLQSAEGEERANIKTQLAKIPSADISTIHSFCARLIRTYFYALDTDRSFEIVVDEAKLADMKERAMDNLFDRLYAAGDGDFIYVLDCLRRKRSDESVRRLIMRAHEAARNVVDYRQKLGAYPRIYCEEGFKKVCADMNGFIREKSLSLLSAFENFFATLKIPQSLSKINVIADEMRASLRAAAEGDLFDPLPPLSSTRRPSGKTEGEKAVGESFGEYRTRLKKKYDALKKDLGSREEECAAFMSGGRLASAFSSLVLAFDDEYAAVKREENKLDCPDLEHLTLKLLSDADIKRQINARYKNVFVDEYQDVNPVQERILTLVGEEEVFTVGDVKQAIYGFRGSKSVFFSRKYADMQLTSGAMRLSVNFRSSDGVLQFVNKLFGDIMTPSSCGIDYAGDGVMHRGGKYPAGYGEAKLVVFGKEQKNPPPAEGVYSVAAHKGARSGHTREGLAVLEIVRRELSRKHYSIEEGRMVDTQPGDICILTRKNAGDSTLGIVRALTDAGYGVEGAGDGDLFKRPEINQLMDILSLIDNCQQDIPLATAMLSPIGGFTRDELARIRISQGSARGLSFRDCVGQYSKARDALAAKIGEFFVRLNGYRRLADVLGAAALIDKILADTGLGARYSSGGGNRLACIRRLQQEAYSPAGELHLNAFLSRIKAGGYSIKAPVPSSSDSIKVVTMHSSKGLEYPVVIVADIARKFGGNDAEETPFDDEYGYCPRAFDTQNKLVRTTVLRELCARRARREEIKNELNLFYVACTRAMCNLYVLCGDVPAYDPAAWYEADCYAKMFDVTAYSPEYMQELTDFEDDVPAPAIVTGKEGAVDAGSLFGAAYSHPGSVNLAVKTSASQLMRDEEAYYAELSLFGDEYAEDGDDDTSLPSGTEAGTAYHRFLELCDFGIKDGEGIEGELRAFVSDGRLSPEQLDLLKVERLVKILNMPAFSALGGAQLWREREFLCSLPADIVFDGAPHEESVLVQGAIDLLAVTAEGVYIIDYKLVRLSTEALKAKYSRQLNLYKSAVARIMKVDERTIQARIIDLRHLKEIIV